jgi:hypothetical protein
MGFFGLVVLPPANPPPLPEMEYGGRVAGIGVSAGKEGDMGRSGQIGVGGKRGVLM